MRPIGKLTERHETALQMRDAGATYKEIGRALGVSGSQAKVLTWQGERVARRQVACPSHKVADFLGVRAFNVLQATAGVDLMSEGAAKIVADMPVAELLNLPNCGKSSLAQIEAWLEYNGLKVNRPQPRPAPRGTICPHCGAEV